MPNLTECIKAGSGDSCPGWLIKFKYDQDIVESLKTTIPHTKREWREETKQWWVSEDYAEQLKALFSNFYALAFLQARLL